MLYDLHITCMDYSMSTAQLLLHQDGLYSVERQSDSLIRMMGAKGHEHYMTQIVQYLAINQYGGAFDGCVWRIEEATSVHTKIYEPPAQETVTDGLRIIVDRDAPGADTCGLPTGGWKGTWAGSGIFIEYLGPVRLPFAIYAFDIGRGPALKVATRMTLEAAIVRARKHLNNRVKSK